MANDQEQVASKSVSEETPKPTFTDKEQTSTSSQADETVERLLGELTPRLRDELSSEMEKIAEKQWQQGKDRRIHGLEDDVSNLKTTIAEYEALKQSGKSDDEAVREMETQRELREMRSQLEKISGGGDSQSNPGKAEVDWMESQQSILENVGMSTADPEFAEFVREKNFENPDEYIKELRNKAFEWQMSSANKPTPSSSTVAQTTPSASAGQGYAGMSDDELAEKLSELQSRPSQTTAERTKIREELDRRMKQ